MSKHNYVLGINESHTATAALIKDGEIIACVSEERFTRIKNQPGFPKNAVLYCLNFAGISVKDLELVAIADQTVPPIFESNPKPDPIIDNPLFNKLFELEIRLELKFPFIRDFIFKLYRNWTNITRKHTQSERIKELQKYLKINNEDFIFIDHHLCHGLAALYSSNFAKKNNRVLIFTVDGVGDNNSATLSIFENNEIKKLYSNPSQNSLGFFYQHVTEFLGFKPVEDEYKVMGLAAYTTNKKSEKMYKLLKQYLTYDKLKLIWRFKVNELLIKKILPKILAYQRFDAIAAATQRILEECLIFWIKNNIQKYNCRNIVCGGGVIANIKANLKIATLKNVKNAFFMFSPGDESNAIGAAYFAFLQLKKADSTLPSTQPVTNLYLGPGFNTLKIKKALEQTKLKDLFQITKPNNINQKVANLLVNNQIVARFSGRMEFGSRALGNRSILANPSKLQVVSYINSAIKNRDFWMPFAPTILRERAKDYLVLHKADSPFMNVAYETTPKARVDLAAAIHPYDKTTRPQILDKEDNLSYWQLIKEFEKLTGIGGVLNTSFNLHGEPIVCNPDDALRVFKISGLKYLVIENYLISKL